jgi:hypothetical protein
VGSTRSGIAATATVDSSTFGPSQVCAQTTRSLRVDGLRADRTGCARRPRVPTTRAGEHGGLHPPAFRSRSPESRLPDLRRFFRVPIDVSCGACGMTLGAGQSEVTPVPFGREGESAKASGSHGVFRACSRGAQAFPVWVSSGHYHNKGLLWMEVQGPSRWRDPAQSPSPSCSWSAPVRDHFVLRGIV